MDCAAAAQPTARSGELPKDMPRRFGRCGEIGDDSGDVNETPRPKIRGTRTQPKKLGTLSVQINLTAAGFRRRSLCRLVCQGRVLEIYSSFPAGSVGFGSYLSSRLSIFERYRTTTHTLVQQYEYFAVNRYCFHFQVFKYK